MEVNTYPLTTQQIIDEVQQHFWTNPIIRDMDGIPKFPDNFNITATLDNNNYATFTHVGTYDEDDAWTLSARQLTTWQMHDEASTVSS